MLHEILKDIGNLRDLNECKFSGKERVTFQNEEIDAMFTKKQI